jgi:hypothetical protein
MTLGMAVHYTVIDDLTIWQFLGTWVEDESS